MNEFINRRRELGFLRKKYSSGRAELLALKVMRDLGLEEIYSFDRGFDRFVRRLPKFI